MFANEKKRHQSADINSGARTGGHELEKELPPIVSANKPTGPNAKPKDMFQHHSIGSPDMLAKS
jgi:hypothetical protein